MEFFKIEMEDYHKWIVLRYEGTFIKIILKEPKNILKKLLETYVSKLYNKCKGVFYGRLC